jgi:quinol monooxygenase YgiN
MTFGLIVRFELKDAAAAAAFDQLVAETTEHIRTAEPGTLTYVTHRVEDAPLSRVFYEIYADRSAFEAHEETAHVRNFLAKREAYVSSFRVEFVTPA